MKNWISFPHVQGVASRQAHCDLPEGSYEREIGKEGFFGPTTHMYHRHPPTSWSDFQGDLRPRAFDTNNLAVNADSPWGATTILSNAHCCIRFWELTLAMPELARNADGDELLFVHEGSGVLFCDYGRLAYRDGDYILLPRGTMWRLEPAADTKLLMVEASNSSFRLPDKGLLGGHSLFDPAMLAIPEMDQAFIAQQTEAPWRVQVKRLNTVSQISFPFNPLDALGWKGDLSVVSINWRDIRPVMSHRYHLPPSAHTSFVSDRFVVTTFCPRPIESDPGALNVPFYHSNDDYEEVIFYHRGEFFSRDNIHPGMITYHPYGFTHGPHPGAFAKGQTRARETTDEVAVMIDARDALDVASGAEGIEWRGYVASWGGMSADKV